MADFYRVYCGQDGNIDYENPVAEMALDDEQVSIPNQDLPPNTIWHFVRRRVSGDCGLESPDSPACIVRIDANGEMLGNIPNAPFKLAAEGLADGKVKLRWRYAKLEEEIAPTGFHIYMDSGAGFDFETPEATVAYRGGGPKAGEFDWTSESLTNGHLYRFCVRSYRLLTCYQVTGEISPDALGDYIQAGMVNDHQYYSNIAKGYYICRGFGSWMITDILGAESSVGWVKVPPELTIITGNYGAQYESTGTAVVSEGTPVFIESQNTNSVSITADSAGPDAITDLIAGVEEI